MWGFISTNWNIFRLIFILIGSTLINSSQWTTTTYDRQQRKRLEGCSHEAVTSATIQAAILSTNTTTHKAACTITNESANAYGSRQSKTPTTQDKNLDDFVYVDRYVKYCELEYNIEYSYSCAFTATACISNLSITVWNCFILFDNNENRSA